MTEAGRVEPLASSSEGASLKDLSLLVKPRLTSVVLLSSVAGFFLGSDAQTHWMLLLHMVAGTALVAAGSSCLNQVMERNIDARMRRTQDRPLPARRLEAPHVLVFGALLTIVGMTYLSLSVNLDAALWATLTLALYVFAYTPLKRVTTLNTLVGAVPGAMPPLIGFAAAKGGLDFRAWILFAIVFVWQLPHFLAIAWLYRADYARAGLKMLPGVDPEGLSTGRQIAVHSLTLLPVSLAPAIFKITGAVYLLGATALGIGFIAFAINFTVKRDDAAARKLFLASVIYLPLLLALMIYDKN
ncbi:MAG TPA: heme o synthase [Planctomycetota bacterium]|nr:heme o synthase [Planctomycetota bacterium]